MEDIKQVNESQINSNPPKKSKSKKIILIIVILLAVGGMASYFTLGNLNIWKKVSILGGGNANSVAVVNGEVITLNEFNLRVSQNKELAKSRGIDVLDEKVIKEIEKTTVDDMVNEKILLQDAKKKGVVANGADVEKAYNEIFTKFKNKDDFTKELSVQNLTEQSLRESIIKQLTLIKYLGQNIDVGNITASEKEMSDVYNALNAKQKNIPKLEQIKTQLENEIKQSKSRAKILELIGKLKEGAKIEISM